MITTVTELVESAELSEDCRKLAAALDHAVGRWGLLDVGTIREQRSLAGAFTPSEYAHAALLQDVLPDFDTRECFELGRGELLVKPDRLDALNLPAEDAEAHVIDAALRMQDALADLRDAFRDLEDDMTYRSDLSPEDRMRAAIDRRAVCAGS
mgnify:CR=1 FL=1